MRTIFRDWRWSPVPLYRREEESDEIRIKRLEARRWLESRGISQVKPVLGVRDGSSVDHLRANG